MTATSGGGKNGPKAIQSRLKDREDIVVDQPSQPAGGARVGAVCCANVHTLRHRHRPGNWLAGLGRGQRELQGLGKRFSGKYYVTKVEHTLGSSDI